MADPRGLYPESLPFDPYALLPESWQQPARSFGQSLGSMMQRGSPGEGYGGPVSGGTGISLADMIPQSKTDIALTLAGLVPVAKLARKPRTLPLFRGISSTSPEMGNYYTPSKDFAREFTQSGLDKEIAQILMSEAAIYRPKNLPFAGEEAELTKAIEKAKAAGFNALFVSEGKGQPHSVFVIDPSALKKR